MGKDEGVREGAENLSGREGVGAARELVSGINFAFLGHSGHGLAFETIEFFLG